MLRNRYIRWGILVLLIMAGLAFLLGKKFVEGKLTVDYYTQYKLPKMSKLYPYVKTSKTAF